MLRPVVRGCQLDDTPPLAELAEVGAHTSVEPTNRGLQLAQIAPRRFLSHIIAWKLCDYAGKGSPCLIVERRVAFRGLARAAHPP